MQHTLTPEPFFLTSTYVYYSVWPGSSETPLPTPRNCTFLENMWWQEPDWRRTTALFSYSISPRCSGSFGHPWMPKGWRITPLLQMYYFSCRAVYFVAFSIPEGSMEAVPHYHKFLVRISLRGQCMWSALAGAPHSYYSSSALSANSVLKEWMNHQLTNK